MKKAVFLASMLVFASACTTEEITNQETANEPIPVEVASVDQKDISNDLELSGQATPGVTIPLAAPSPLKVTEINVTVGSTVEKGDLIAALDDSTARENVTQLTNAVNELEKAVNQAKELSGQAEKSAQELKDLQSELNHSLERSKELLSELDSEEVTAADVLKESLEVTIKQAQLSQAAAQVPSMSAGNVTQLETQLSETKASLNQAQDVLNATTIESPINGIVSQINAEENAAAVPSTPLAVVVNLNPIKATFQVNSFQISQLKKDQDVAITFDGVDGTFDGKLKAIPPTANEQTGSFLIEIPLENKDLKIKGGMKATATIQTDLIENAIVVPKESIIYGEEETFVYVPQGKKVKQVNVELGAETDKTIQITSGLSKGDQVITEGKDRLNEASEIQVQK
ncbi:MULTISPECIES: efflux RND transporter periplasmic adaptor subunit [unclassified Bacillus (in: firmicutes)]|uniref:efflux RND transporter periplasmic adaptor subunit n=1 Tax=unclassified Bacillus (in: firmicutes) TaxID=185979 RepID=UPI000BF65AE7|nr:MULTISPECIES: efflux RND transporter periplasmic adaptor subunit [unclassified Bacillus (in: firmicutes)]PFG12696.1 RND family efflux transporter MFP subunit [Bacillus sp. es.036]